MKKLIALMLFFILSFTSIPLASAQSIANCNLHCFSAGTPVQTKTGFKPIEQIRIGDFVLTKDELTGKTGYNTVIGLYQRQATETYQITVKGMTITTTEEHPFWVPSQGWVEAQHLKTGDLLQNPEGKTYPIKRIEIKNDRTTVYNFRVQGVHNYFVTELEIWTHNCGAGGIRNVPMRAPTGGGSSQASKGTGKGLEGRGYKPQSGERTFEGYVKDNVPVNKETKLFTNSKSFNANPKNDGQFKRFGTDSHAGLSPHVHQPKRNVAPDGTIHGTVGKKTNDGGVRPPNSKDVSQLYDHLNNRKYPLN